MEPPASPYSTPRFTLNILGQGRRVSLIAEGWIQGKPCQVTIDTGATVTIARPDIFAGQPERKPSRTCLTDCLLRDLPGAERGLCRAEFGTAGPEDMGVCRGSYGRVHPGVRCPAGLLGVRGRRTTFAATGPGGGDAMETRRPTKICLALTGRRRIDSGPLSEGGDGKIGGTCRGDQRSRRIQPELFPRWGVYSQGSSPRQAEGTCKHHECDQSRPSTE